MANEQRLMDADAFGSFLLGKMGFNPATAEMLLQWMDEYLEKNTIDAVEVVRIEEVKQEILQIMDNFIAEYNRIGFYGNADVMDIAKRLVNAALIDLCDNCGADMRGY